jgi:hypothetical protein
MLHVKTNFLTASNVTVIINNEYVSEGNEVSRAGLEKEIIAVKSENTIFFTVQQRFSTDRTRPAIGRLHASG